MLIFRFILLFGGSTRIGLRALMFKKDIIFLILHIAIQGSTLRVKSSHMRYLFLSVRDIILSGRARASLCVCVLVCWNETVAAGA